MHALPTLNSAGHDKEKKLYEMLEEALQSISEEDDTAPTDIIAKSQIDDVLEVRNKKRHQSLALADFFVEDR